MGWMALYCLLCFDTFSVKLILKLALELILPRNKGLGGVTQSCYQGRGRGSEEEQ